MRFNKLIVMITRSSFRDIRSFAFFVSFFCVLNSFSQNIECETTFVNGMYISASEGAIANDNLSGCKFKIITQPAEFEYYYVISYNGKIGNQGMSILRQYNESNRDAKFYFANGKSFAYSVRIADHTPQDWKEFEGLADMYIVFMPVVKKSNFSDLLDQMKLFCNVDISYITIGNYTLQFKNKGIKSAPYFNALWKDMYEHGGWNFLTKSTESNSSSSVSSSMIKKNLALGDFLNKPMGCVNSDLINGSYDSIKNGILQLFKADVDHLCINLLESQNSNCSGINYHGLSFNYFTLFEFLSSRSITYRFDLNQSGTNTDPYKYMDMISRDFNNLGIRFSYKKINDKYTKAKGSAQKGQIKYGVELNSYGTSWCFEIKIEKSN